MPGTGRRHNFNREAFVAKMPEFESVPHTPKFIKDTKVLSVLEQGSFVQSVLRVTGEGAETAAHLAQFSQVRVVTRGDSPGGPGRPASVHSAQMKALKASQRSQTSISKISIKSGEQVSPLERLFRKHGVLVKTMILPYLMNVVPTRTMKNSEIEIGDSHQPGLHVFKLAHLNKRFREYIKKMYWPLNVQKLGRDSKINRFVEMLYSDPEFVSETWQEEVNTSPNFAIRGKN